MNTKQAVRLRLHHGGTFKKDPENGECKYMGGSVYNDSIEQSFKYHQLCLRVNQKVGEPVSIKYQDPGTPLDVESLVSVTDDDDLQEMFNEYWDALQRPGIHTRTFRIHVFLQPALQFEIERTEAEQAAHEEDMEPSLCCHDAFDDYSEAFSYEPSSDTEWQAAHGMAQAQMYSAATSGMAGLHVAHNQAVRMADAQPTHAAALRWDGVGLEDHALSNLNRSLQACPVLCTPVGKPALVPAFTADDFNVEDPYMEDPDVSEGYAAVKVSVALANGCVGLQPTGRTNPPGKIGEPGKLAFGSLKGTPLSNRPLDRVRDAANGLPSHISAFGEGYSSDSVAAEPPKGGSLKLPSHISAFGEGSDMQQDGAPDTILQGTRQTALRASHCITQDFGEQSRSSPPSQGVPSPTGGPGRMDINVKVPNGGGGQDMLCPTPKVLLDSVKHVSRSQVSSTSKIGEGAFGEVSCGDVFPYGTVAIKWLKKDRFAKYSESFQREAEVLARLNHPNIIRMFGLVTEPASSPPSSSTSSCATPQGDYAANGCTGSSSGSGDGIIAGIIMEYLRGGSLAQRFRTFAQAGRRIGLKERCRIALQAALGMSYLHDQSPAVIHFDLKPDNLLLEGEGDNILVKVADFGLSKHKIQSYVTCHDLRGTLPYMAPELVKCPNQVCEKCDVWSMGVVMWEMVTLEVPFQELTAQDILRGLMQGSLHLRMPPTCETEWQQLITACMEPDPTARPTFRKLAEKLEDMSKRLAAAHQQELMQQQQQVAAVAAAAAQQQQQQHLFAQQANLALPQQVFPQHVMQAPLQQQQQALVRPLAPAQAQALLFAHQAARYVPGVFGDASGLPGLGHDIMTHLYHPPQDPAPAFQHHHLLQGAHHNALGLHHLAAPYPLHH